MKITTKKPLRPRGRSDEKRQSTKDAIREVYANGPQLEVQIIPAKKDLATDKKGRGGMNEVTFKFSHCQNQAERY